MNNNQSFLNSFKSVLSQMQEQMFDKNLVKLKVLNRGAVLALVNKEDTDIAGFTAPIDYFEFKPYSNGVLITTQSDESNALSYRRKFIDCKNGNTLLSTKSMNVIYSPYPEGVFIITTAKQLDINSLDKISNLNEISRFQSFDIKTKKTKDVCIDENFIEMYSQQLTNI